MFNNHLKRWVSLVFCVCISEALFQTLATSSEQVAAAFDSALKAVLSVIFSKQGPLGGIKFSLSDDAFDAQPAVHLLPRSLVGPVEVLVTVCIADTNELVKDGIAGLLMEVTAHRFEQFILTVSAESFDKWS
jgi:hypothetical protein